MAVWATASLTVEAAVGAERTDPNLNPLPGGEDFSYMLQQVPGCYAFIGNGFGDPDEFGAACAFLCSTHAGYITGQNLLIDGGNFPGTF